MSTIDVRNFRQNLRHFERELNVQNNSGCCCGVTLAQCHALMELHNKDSIQLNELSEKLYLDTSTVSRTIENLVNQNLVSREIPKNNRRATLIKLTEQGQDVCKTIHEGNDAYFNEALNSIPNEILPQLLKGFEMLVNKMIYLNKSQTCNS